MTDITLSAMELQFLKDTLELALEEFAGIEEGRADIEDYVLTTGAYEDCKEAYQLVNRWWEQTLRVEEVDPDDWEDEMEFNEDVEILNIFEDNGGDDE